MCWGAAEGIGWEPALDDAGEFAGGVAVGVDFGVAYSASGADGLGLSGTEDGGGFGAGVSMSHFAFDDPGDDFLVFVEVHVEAFAGGDDVVVVDHEEAEGVCFEVEVAGGGEGLTGDDVAAWPNAARGGWNKLNG